jgi:[ribosomal protein S5]-alanine N-acetyltransferase
VGVHVGHTGGDGVPCWIAAAATGALELKIAETARLRLRQLTLDDAPLVFALLSDPDFIKNVGDRGVHSATDARCYIESGPLASYERYGFGLYLVELKSPANGIGMCGLLHRDTHADVEIGFALLPRFRRQGYTLEAARAIVHLATGSLGLTRIVAIVAPFNLASIRILETLGMKYERQVNYAPDGSESSLFVLERPTKGSAQ